MSIEGIALEHLSALPQTEIKLSIKSCPPHAVFHYFLSYDRKQYAETTTENIKRLIELLKEKKVLTSTLSTIWEIPMVVQISIYVPQNYKSCKFCPKVTQL